jgi:hypothetical protein
MNKKDEALEMAKKALDINDECECGRSEYQIESLFNAVNALMEAIQSEASESETSSQQEPYGYIAQDASGLCKPIFNKSEKQLLQTVDDLNHWDDFIVKPLYAKPTEDGTSPSKARDKEFVTLTDDEIDALEHNDFTCWGRDDLIVFGRAIEQELKAKNAY